MVVNFTRAWFSAGDAFWKKSFHTSTGYVLWLCTEQFNTLTKLLAVRFLALENNRQEVKQSLSELMEISIRREM